MEASQKPQLSFTAENQQGRPLWSLGRGISLEEVDPEGVARLSLMINSVLPRLTKA